MKINAVRPGFQVRILREDAVIRLKILLTASVPERCRYGYSERASPPVSVRGPWESWHASLSAERWGRRPEREQRHSRFFLAVPLFPFWTGAEPVPFSSGKLT